MNKLLRVIEYDVSICAGVNVVRMIIILFCPVLLLAQAQVDSVMPIQNAINVSGGTDITVFFDTDMDSVSINDTTFIALGSHSGLHLGTINYNSVARSATLDPVDDFLVGEIATVMLTKAITDTAAVPIDGYLWNFTIIAINGTGMFSSPQEFSANDGPHGIYAAYLNNDNNLDLVVTNVVSQDYSVLFGNGDGTFSVPANQPTGAEPYAVVCGDLDKDGDNDWVAVSAGDNLVYVYLNDGNGSGNPAGQFITGSYPVAGFISDFNRDGHLDIATANQGTNNASVLFGNGDGTFQPSNNYGLGPSPNGIFGGDFDEDGDVDLAATTRANGKIAILLNDGDGTFSSGGDFNVGNGPQGIYAVSLNSSDNFLDLISANTNADNISVLLGNGDGTFGASTEYLASIAPVDLKGSDIDTDSDLDILASSAADSISLLKNDGNASFGAPINFYGGDSTTGLCTGDFNNDGSIDIAVTCFNSDSVAVLLNSTDTIPPYIVTTLPDSGETGVLLNTNIFITFSEPMDTASLDTSKFHVSGNINPVYSYVLSYDSLNYTVGLNPDSLFAVNETVSVDVSQTVTDTAGNSMIVPYSFFFVTAAAYDTVPPWVAHTSPDSGETGVALDSWIFVTFTEKVDPASVTSDKILIEGDISGVYSFWMSYSEVDSTLSINPDSDFATAESIDVYVMPGIQDLAGNTMDSTYWWWFRTAEADTLGPDFDITIEPSPANIGDSVKIIALPNELLHQDSAVVCSVITADHTLHTLTLLSDSIAYTNKLNTVGFVTGVCSVKVFGYDQMSNYGFATTSFSISPGGEFLPEEMVYAWPNPAKDNTIYFHFYVNANAEISVDVFNLEGKRVTRLDGRGEGGRPPHQQSSNAIVWDISNIASDVYVFKLGAVSDATGEKKSVIKKFAIVR